MSDPALERGEMAAALRQAALAAEQYVAQLDASLVQPRGDASIEESLSAEGVGSLQSLAELAMAISETATRSSGPRFFHFVMGGGTPAAVGADWLTSTIDQNAYNWISSPFGMRLEQISVSWLKDMFGVPAEWSGVLTSGATMSNFAGLASARRWWGLEQGVDIDSRGFAGLPSIPVFAGGYLHASAVKALGMLGVGRQTPRLLTRDDAGRFDVPALERELVALEGRPSIVIATAGDVNTGDFDPIRAISALTRRHHAWLHIDGAFGLFAALSPSTRHLVDGVDAADSIAVDGHKWLNVPYDTGFAFVRDSSAHAGAFAASAAYLGQEALARPVFGNLGPEMSRRARALPVWATLRAYGRDGYRAMVERHVSLAQRVARQVDAASDLERLADTQLNVVCFRYRPREVPESDLDEFNRRLGAMVLEDGRVYFGTTEYMGKVAFRPAVVNWRTREEDVDLIVEVVRELGARLLATAQGR